MGDVNGDLSRPEIAAGDQGINGQGLLRVE